MEYDVVIVGGGPAGLATAIRLRQLAMEQAVALSVCVLEKGSEIGAHTLSGAIMDPRALNELIADWKQQGAPLNTSVEKDEVWLFSSAEQGRRMPAVLIPKPMHNRGNYVVSLGNVCRWLGEQAEALEVEIFPGFPAAEVLYGDQGEVCGVGTGDMGLTADGSEKDSYAPGMELRAKYTVFAEGARGHLGRQLIRHFRLDVHCAVQHYGLGIKELWDLDPAKHQPGLVIHGGGWPLNESGSAGGFFLYHLEQQQAAVGLIVDLNFSNPYLSPFEEFQRLKHHPVLKNHLAGGCRVSYGARAITKGGLHSLPKMVMPGALLVGCDAGTLNYARIKGTHTAMKSGMLAAETLFQALAAGDEGGQVLESYTKRFRESWLYQELYTSRNFAAALHKWGTYGGGTYNLLDQNLFGGRLPWNLADSQPDYLTLRAAAECPEIEYPKPDGQISFDRLSSVYLSNTNHEADQPCHLRLLDESIPVGINLARYAGLEQRYCPAGVYEFVDDGQGGQRLQINAQNCVHCKACDIKDPSQNITWVTPEGGGGPNYPNM